jgi:hypothetical protein
MAGRASNKMRSQNRAAKHYWRMDHRFQYHLRPEILKTLRQAQALVSHGWSEHHLAEDALGAPVDFNSREAVKFSIAGAIFKVMDDWADVDYAIRVKKTINYIIINELTIQEVAEPRNQTEASAFLNRMIDNITAGYHQDYINTNQDNFVAAKVYKSLRTRPAPPVAPIVVPPARRPMRQDGYFGRW